MLVTSRAYEDGGTLLGALHLEEVERVLAENAEGIAAQARS